MLVQATDGNLYSAGSSAFQPNGYIYRMTPAGEVTILHSFCMESGCSDGSVPLPPILGSDGNLYGVTLGGGNSDVAGIVYKLTLSGEFMKLYSFCADSSVCPDGQSPNGIIQASDGNLYGVTSRGGGNVVGGAGTIFSLSTTGNFKLLYTFCSLSNCADGQTPLSQPIQGDDGNFYGTAQLGGTGGMGVAYKLTPAGAYSVIYNFCSAVNCTDGAQPAALSLGPHGDLFGIANIGGFKNCGTAFRIGPNNRYTVIHRFSDLDVCSPYNSALTLANDGNFYGVLGPYSGGGFIYQLTSEGGFTTLYDFSCCRGGYDPAGMLLQATDGNFYGTTLSSPAVNFGAVFKFSNGLGPLVETVPTAGKVGKSVIILGNGLTGTSSV
jgi:uncharacterized repeat protein (TIGR03803 family)